MREIAASKPVKIFTFDGKSVPEDQHDDGPAVVTLRGFVLGRISNPAAAGDRKGMEAVIFLTELATKIKACPEDGPMLIEDEDWSAINRATVSPEGGYNLAIAWCLVPHMKAVTEAKVVKVEKAEEKPAEEEPKKDGQDAG